MSRWLRRWTSPFAVAGGLVCYAGALTAQQPAASVLEGQVVDAAGAAIADLDVMLHRVTASGGAVVAQARTGADGRFRIEPGDSLTEGVYFAAIRYEGRLHIGPMIRPPFTSIADYVVRVGDEAAAAASPVSASQPREQYDVAPALVIALIATGAAAATILAARRPAARRRLLIRLARDEERAASSDASAGSASG